MLFDKCLNHFTEAVDGDRPEEQKLVELCQSFAKFRRNVSSLRRQEFREFREIC
jgi:hypothetical protein